MKKVCRNAVQGLLLGALLLSGQGWSQSWSFRDPHDPVPHNAEEYEWEEQKAELPPFPREEDLIEIDFQRPDSRFRYYTDPAALSIGEDQVVRYVIVLRANSGAENVMYEGIRCDEYDFKTFAYGSRNGEFKLLRNPQWREISATGNNWFRHDLWKRFLCIPEAELAPRSRTEILTAIQYHRNNGQGRK